MRIPTNIAAQAALDARVFTIFDGTNDLLSQQLSEYCLARLASRSLSGFLADWSLTAPDVTACHRDLSFLDRDLGQEHLVLAGRATTWPAATSSGLSSISGCGAHRPGVPITLVVTFALITLETNSRGSSK